MQRWCARVVEERWFHTTTAAVIVANAVLLGLGTYPSLVTQHGGLLNALDTACLAYFIGELAIRLGAYGKRPLAFFRDPWNVFDFAVVALALTPGIRENATLLRLARLARVLRVVRIFPTMRIIVLAVWRSLPGTASLAVVGVILLYLYGMLGWTLFAEKMPEQYGSIGRATLTLFCLMLFDGLSDSLKAGLEISPWTLLYFVSFVVFAGFLLVNILLGVVLNSMEEARALESEERAEREPGGGDPAGSPAPATPPNPMPIDRIAALREAVDELEAELRRDPVLSGSSGKGHGE
ncbi:ion transporter [Longispora albida]|uniref:ion transporter n=1 Tax=Longispora albida TaxID=203523 RepID=UPI0003722CF0|nr:ion transporter [Longispora albida]